MAFNILGVIPARYASTRFPAKALADLGGKSMIQRVYEQVNKSDIISKIVVATDHETIFDHVASFGGKAMITADHHQSGTDRCLEVLNTIDDCFDFVINIQGDEPFIDPSQIDTLAGILTKDVEIATLIKEISDSKSLFDPNVVKIIKNLTNRAIYFSRTPIPYFRGLDKEDWLNQHTYYKHLGIYGYRSDILQEIGNLKVSSLEKAESLEQLRWLENGYQINVKTTHLESIGIDTPEDLEAAKKLL